MENFIIYLVKASGLIAVFYLAYYLLLRKETFFVANRKFMLLGLITAIVLPLLVVTRTVWIEARPHEAMQALSNGQLIWLQNQMAAKAQASSINWYDVAAGMYAAGVLFLLVRFTLELLSLRRLLKNENPVKENSYRLIDTNAVATPFSFFRYIVYNSSVVNNEELAGILAHEKVHSRQKHSLDMIIGQLFCIGFWFNPFVWLYKKAISQNLEFIADAGAAKNLPDLTSYQKTLLKITVQPECIAITNHFYQSLIKKRIVMLNKKQSRKRNSWKYAAVLPALAAFMLFFQLKVNAQEKDPVQAQEKSMSAKKISVGINKDATDAELEQNKKLIKEMFNADVNFSDVKRNANGEITGIKVTVSDKEQNETQQFSGDEPIKPFSIDINQAGSHNKIAFGKGRDGISMSNLGATITADTIYVNHGNLSQLPPPPPVPQIHGIQITPAPAPVPPHVLNGIGTTGNIAINNSDMLVVVNGVKKEKGEAVQIPSNEEIDGMVILDKKEAKNKYGRDGRKGAIEITTRKKARSAYVLQSGGQSPMVMSWADNNDMQQAMVMADRMKVLKGMDLDIPDSLMNGEFVMADGLSPEEIASLKEEMKGMKTKIMAIINDKQFNIDFDEDSYKEAREEMTKEVEKMRSELRENRNRLQEKREERQKERQKAMQERQKANEKRQQAEDEQMNKKS